MDKKIPIIAAAALAANASAALADPALGQASLSSGLPVNSQAESAEASSADWSPQAQTHRTFMFGADGDFKSWSSKKPPPPVLPKIIERADGSKKEVPGVYVQTASTQGEVVDMRLVLGTPSAEHAETLAEVLERTARQLRDPEVLARATGGYDPGIVLDLRAAIRVG
jgi:hypothetical protein